MTDTVPNEQPLLTSADAARIADVTPSMVRTAAKSGQLATATVTAGGVRLFTRAAVLEWRAAVAEFWRARRRPVVDAETPPRTAT